MIFEIIVQLFHNNTANSTLIMSCRRITSPIRMLVFRRQKWSKKSITTFETYPDILAGAITKDKSYVDLDKTVKGFVAAIQDLDDSRFRVPEKVAPESLLVIDRDPVFLEMMNKEFDTSTLHICKYTEWPKILGERMYKASSIAFIPHAIDQMQ